MPRDNARSISLRRPLAVLALQERQVTLRLRPSLLAARFVGHPWTAAAEPGVVVFPVRGSGFARGVGVQVGAGRPWYFWCGRRQLRVLTALEDAGFTVDATERRPDYR